jgi:hypothetical protein
LFHVISTSLAFIAALLIEGAVLALISIPLCLLPGGLLVVLHLCGTIRWTTPAHGSSPEVGLSSIRLMMISWLGSFIGVIFAFLSFLAADQWDYMRYPDHVRDGQTGFALIFSGPMCALLGVVLVAAACRLFLCVPTERLSAAPWMYSGNHRTANRSTVASLLAVQLSVLFICSFFLNWLLVHSGPW